MTLVIAHRGASADAPENTAPAFRLALEQGADMIETDLHLARDGTVPLFHDDRVGGDAVGGLDGAALRERCPGLVTLEEALDELGAHIAFNLELKHGVHGYPGLPERALREVRARGLLERTLFSSFWDGPLAALRALESEARIGLLVGRRSNVDPLSRARRLGAEAVHPDRAVLTEALVEELHAAGLGVHAFTVDDPAEQRRLLAWGVDGIFTNAPGRLRALLREGGEPQAGAALSRRSGPGTPGAS